MNEKCLRTLEYNKIINMLCENTVSDMGKDIARDLVPSKDIHEIRELLQETTEAVNLTLKKGNAPLGDIQDIRVPLRKVKMGACLDPGELLKIANALRNCRVLKSYINEKRAEQQFPIIEYYIDTLSSFKAIEESIYNAIENEEDISDRASSLLHSIRRKLKDKVAGIKEKLNHMVTSSAYSKYLQEGIVTVRGDRHVIPVKQEYRAQVPGIVHDQSSTGATLFIEPMVIVEMQNELKQLRLNEAEEIQRILYELTGLVGEKYDSIKLNAEILATLDFIFAKAKLSLEYRCVEPKINDKGIINVKKARHPLIDEKKVVPIDIYIGESFNTLVITGPNTGGKTVTLKTMGLLTLMTQAGLHIPAGEYSEMAVFDEVFADIGDEQSIEQSLSTFSSHMTNIVSILKNITTNSLVLFDELGAGTDPTEGAALAMSILELLYKRNIRTAATTHYSELKIHALSTPGVCNASVEFDVATLSPTYRLLIGIPGKSNAFEISNKLGLSDDIIKRAREFISKEDIEFEDVIKELQENRRKTQEESDLASRMRMDIERNKKELDNKLDKLDEQKEKILRDAQKEALTIVKRSKLEADQIIKELQEAMEKETADKAVIIEQARMKLKKKQDETEEKIGQEVFNKVSNKPPKKLNLGDTVKIVNLNQKGYVLTLPDEQGNLMVQAGIMKVNVNINNLSIDIEEKQTTKNKTNLHLSNEKALSISSQVDVRGQSLEEAMMNVDKYIDDAYLTGAGQITIIHGKGTGILRTGISQMLRSNSHVKSYRIGAFNEGGNGATIVEIKS